MLVGFFDISVSISAELKYANQCMRASKLKLCLCNITIKPDKHKSKHKKKNVPSNKIEISENGH